MTCPIFARAWTSALLFAILTYASRAEAASGCVWKVTDRAGGTLYLGGSIHSLRSIDYPLPPAYNVAFEASTRMACEVDRKALLASGDAMLKSGRYREGDSLKNHVDPRTYDYVRRFFALLSVPEAKVAQFRPWLLVALLEAASPGRGSDDLGVEGFLLKRAEANKKPIIGLETLEEHVRVFAGLSDRQSEALLLISFIPQEDGRQSNTGLMKAWRSGDVDSIARMLHDSFREFPAFGDRLLDQRNRNWLPKIERELHSGETYFVVVGAAHLGGPGGLLAMLRARGYRLEQL